MEKNNLRKNMFDLVAQLCGQNNLLTIPRFFIDFMGSLDGALFLSQMLYWTGKGNNPDGWIYKTFNEWEEELTLSKYKINKARQTLEGMGALETTIKKANGNPTVHYRLKRKELEEALVKFLNTRSLKNLTNHESETLQSLTETTTETTNRDFALQARELKSSRCSSDEDSCGEDFIGYIDSIFNSRSDTNVFRGK